MANLCILGQLASDADDSKPRHYHDPCACLDVHVWTPVAGDRLGCLLCGAIRCVVTDGGEQCLRSRLHGKRHLFAVAST